MKCEKIASEFGYKHLSTGDLLREEQKKESELATKIAECIRCAIPIFYCMKNGTILFEGPGG